MSSFLPAAAYCCWRSASAWLRRSLAAVLSSAPPSMSKSSRVRFSPSMTRLYCVSSEETDVQEMPISVPEAPPKEAMTSPPAAAQAVDGGGPTGVGDRGVAVEGGVAAAAVDDEGEGEVLQSGGVARVGQRGRRVPDLGVGGRVVRGEAGAGVGGGLRRTAGGQQHAGGECWDVATRAPSALSLRRGLLMCGGPSLADSRYRSFR